MKIIATALFFVGVLMAGIVNSHSGAKGIVKERMDAMENMGDKSKLVADMLKGEREFDATALVDAADAFVLHGTRMAELFPDTEESRTGSNTEALPRIWDEWDDFSKRVNEFIELSESLKTTVSTTEDVGQLKKAFFQTRRSCSGCHKRFRKPKD
ncbi:MAG: cytochrome c [Granulosicoccus sp.]